MTDTLQLGGNIELTGFSDLEPAVMVVVKKIVGNYAKKLSKLVENFEKLHLTLKKVHQTEKSEKYELHARLLGDGKAYASENIDMNLFFCLDKVLKRIESEIGK
jgi:ribosome-associated translation inhibitor RaiA